MSFSKEWEVAYKNETHMSVWPWSDLISLIHKHTPIRTASNTYKVLELGCGAGANIPFFKSFDVEYYGVDGSETIINLLSKKFPNYAKNLGVADFTKEIPFKDIKFDLIIDRAAITHNKTTSIVHCLDLIKKCLDVNGIFIGTGWFSTDHSEYRKGVEVEDKFTKTDIVSGPLAGLGEVHFSNKEHLLNLFKEFSILQLDHINYQTVLPQGDLNVAYWSLAARKK